MSHASGRAFMAFRTHNSGRGVTSCSAWGTVISSFTCNAIATGSSWLVLSRRTHYLFMSSLRAFVTSSAGSLLDRISYVGGLLRAVITSSALIERSCASIFASKSVRTLHTSSGSSRWAILSSSAKSRCSKVSCAL